MRHPSALPLLMVLACAACTPTQPDPPQQQPGAAAAAIDTQHRPVLASSGDGCGCWDLYWGLRADCDRRHQNYLDTCNGMEEPDRSHCYNGAEYWRDVCHQDAWWEFESCIRNCG